MNKEEQVDWSATAKHFQDGAISEMGAREISTPGVYAQLATGAAIMHLAEVLQAPRNPKTKKAQDLRPGDKIRVGNQTVEIRQIDIFRTSVQVIYDQEGELRGASTNTRDALIEMVYD